MEPGFPVSHSPRRVQSPARLPAAPGSSFISSERTVVPALVTDKRRAERRAHPARIAHLDARVRLGLGDADHLRRLPLPGERRALGRRDLERMGTPVIDPEDGAVGTAVVGDRCPLRLAARAVSQPQCDACLADAVVDRQRVDRGSVAAAALGLRILADAAISVASVPRRGRCWCGRGS